MSNQTAQLPPAPIDQNERDCLLRAMYFESNRSSYDGLMAVGTVVMNRKDTGKFGNSVCEVVGQRNQFAAGALTRKVSPRESALAEKAADAIMAGERHASMDYVMYFHTAGLHFPYTNMHYRLVAGGNAFYERYPRVPKLQPQDTMIASGDATQQPAAAAATTQPAVAAASPLPPPGVATVPAIADASTGSSFATAAPPSEQPQPAAAGTSPIVDSPQTQTSLAYAAAPARPAAPEQASPLFKAFASALSDRQQTAAAPQTAAAQSPSSEAGAGASAAPAATTAPAATAATPTTDTSAPVPR